MNNILSCILLYWDVVLYFATIDNYVINTFFIKHFLYFGVFSRSPKSRITTKFKALDIYFDVSYSSFHAADYLRKLNLPYSIILNFGFIMISVSKYCVGYGLMAYILISFSSNNSFNFSYSWELSTGKVLDSG